MSWFTEILATRRALIEAELVAATGGASLCSISRSAGSVPAAKYLEGRLTAVRDLSRLVAKTTTKDPRHDIEQLLPTWQQGLDHSHDHDRGTDWIAYFAGGVDELTELAANIAERTH